MKRKLSCFLFLFVVLVTFFNVVGCKDQSVIIYTVLFNPNGGELTSNNSQKILSGDNVIVPSDPKREEYIFTGWYTESECINLYDFNNQVSGSFTLYAGWSRIEYTIIFDANGGVFSGNTSEKILSGEKVIEPALEPYNTYCSFTGWYTEPECINLYDFNTPVTSSFTLYAGWTEVLHICINNIKEDSVYMVPVPYGEKLPELEQPFIDGVYDFTGWYTEPECINLYDFNTPVTSSFTLYAGWSRIEYTIIFDANGGYFSIGDYYYETYTLSFNVSNGSCVTQPTSPSWGTTAVFSNWYTEPECINLYDFNTPVTSNITLYAGWIPVHCINFESDGNSSFDSFDYQFVVDGNFLICPDKIPENYGKVFTGWYTEPECTNLYNFNKPVTSSFTLYAGWGEELIYYTITFDANGGTLTSEPTQVVLRYGKITEPINPTREGYTFTGWYDDTQCTDLIDFDYIVVDHDRTLYAGWTVTTYTVTFNANGGDLTCDTTQPVTIGNKVIHPSNSTRDEYDFTGWYTEPECINLYDFNSQVYNDFTLYAGWLLTTYTVSFNANGGVLTSNTNQTVSNGSKVTQPSNPTRDEYIFTGWYTDSSCTNLYDFNSQVTSDLILYAGWGIKTYVVNFNANGGVLTGNTNQTVSSGSTVTQPSNPTRNEYDFTGWYTDIDCTNKYDFENQITSSFTLYAGWEIKNYTITFNANGGIFLDNLTQTVPSGNSIYVPIEPTRELFVFVGWYTDQACTVLYDFNKQVTSSFTLYAGWDSLINTVTFNANGGSLTDNDTQTVSWGNPIYEPREPTRNEYYFSGWYIDSNCSIPYDFNKQVTSTFTLYAGWRDIDEYFVYLIDSLNGVGPHDVVLEGKIKDTTLPLLGDAIKNSYSKINLDISNVTGINYISNNVFKDCSRLISIILPKNVTSIGVSAFENCTGLTNIELPSGLTVIGNGAFKGCTGLTNIDIPSGVTKLENETFFECTGLISIDLPNRLTSIGEYVFFYCTKLSSIILPDNVISIGSGAFCSCTELTSINIPSRVSILEDDIFSGCKLTNISIPNGVTAIGSGAFWGCPELTNINIPSSVTNIGEGAFYYCIKLTNINLPDGLISIGNSAFTNCIGLTNITLPDGITSIGYSAFRNCTGLQSVDLPDSLTIIDDSLFSNCTSLTSINLPDGLISIDNNAFSNTGLTSINLPKELSTISRRAFMGCIDLKTVYFEDESTWYYTGLSNYTLGTQISVSNPSRNAKNFTDDYLDYYWYKE